MRKAMAVLAGLAVLGAANWAIYAREKQLAEGAVVLLELAPVDPRSLMQGDYMALRFGIENAFSGGARAGQAADGRIVVRPDARGVAAFVRLYAGEPLAPGEALLRYRVRGGKLKFATNAYFFQEGTARLYERARFGEFRASPGGDLLLTHLRGEKLERLGPP